MAIESVQLHTNRNAPEGANGVYLYNTDTAENLTLGQLLSAVCLRAGAVLERQSVSKMNLMTQENGAINRLSEILEGIASETLTSSGWDAVRNELISDYAMGADLLPTDLNSYDARMQVMMAIKRQLESRTQQAQEDMIDLQTLVNRRDVAFTTSTNIIRALGQSATNMAGKLAR